MGDFYQNGPIATFHDLGHRPSDQLDAALVGWAAQRPIALMIPALASELEGEALPEIVSVLREVRYLDQVIIGLDQATPEEFDQARRLVSVLPMDHRVVWNDGPRLSAVQEVFAQRAGAPSEPGKGHNVWYGLGYFLGARRGSVLALHDADILTYSSEMLTRLLYPVVHPDFGYAFSKGYYFRADDERLNGRVARLLVAPLLRALRETLGPNDYLDYIGSFRYPLAGECAMDLAVARKLRIPFNWGLEIGMLSELYRSDIESRVCQVDLADAYDHKHQDPSSADPERGLHRMAMDIAGAFYRRLAMAGEELSPRVVSALEASFARNAESLADRYRQDAEMNGYSVDAAADESLIEIYRGAILASAHRHLSSPDAETLMPSWSTVIDTVPEAMDSLVAAVDLDNEVG